MSLVAPAHNQTLGWSPRLLQPGAAAKAPAAAGRARRPLAGRIWDIPRATCVEAGCRQAREAVGMGSATGWLFCPSSVSAGGDASSSFSSTQGICRGIPLRGRRGRIPQPGEWETWRAPAAAPHCQWLSVGLCPLAVSLPLRCWGAGPALLWERGPLRGEQLPLTAQRLLHDEVHGAGVCVWLGQCPALIHRCPGLLTWATCAGTEGQVGDTTLRFPAAQAEGWNDLWGCALHPLHPQHKCLPGWAEGGSGVCRQRVTVPAPLSPLPTSLLALRTCGGTKERMFHLSTALGVAPGAQVCCLGAGGMRTHHATIHCVSLL